MSITPHGKRTVSTQAPSPTTRTACKETVTKCVSWTVHTCSRVAVKLSRCHKSKLAQALAQAQEFKRDAEFLSNYHSLDLIARSNRHQVGHADLNSGALYNDTSDFLYWGEYFFFADEGVVGHDQSDYGKKLEKISHEDISGTKRVDMLYSLNGQQPLSVPRIILTTPEGSVITGNDIPKGGKCHHSHEYHELKRQWLASLEVNLVPGDWKQLRDRRRPDAKIGYYKKKTRASARDTSGSGRGSASATQKRGRAAMRSINDARDTSRRGARRNTRDSWWG